MYPSLCLFADSEAAGFGGGDTCYNFQCNKCKEYFLGLPTDSHPCFRQMNVNTEFCLDMTPLSTVNCNGKMHNAKKADSNNKNRGNKGSRLSFFAVQPKFMNVDIRIFLDITSGRVDLLLSPESQVYLLFSKLNSFLKCLLGALQKRQQCFLH